MIIISLGIRVILVVWGLCASVTHCGRSLNSIFELYPFPFDHTNLSAQKNLVTWAPVTFVSTIYKNKLESKSNLDLNDFCKKPLTFL